MDLANSRIVTGILGRPGACDRFVSTWTRYNSHTNVDQESALICSRR